MPIDARIPMAVRGANAFRPAETLASGTALNQRQDVLDMKRNQFDYDRAADERELNAPEEFDVEGLSKTFNTVGQVLGGAQNQADWDQRLQYLKTNINPQHASAFDWNAMPGVYTPEGAREVAMSFLEVPKQLAQQNREREFGLRERDVAATEAGKRGTTVSVGGPSIVSEKSQGSFGTQIGKDWAAKYTGMQQAAMEGTKRLANLSQMDRLLENVQTGTFATTKLALSKALGGMGFDPQKMSWLAGLSNEAQIGQAEAATALANEMALQLRNPAGGAGMPGAMSDKDREFLTSMIAGLGTTREGRKLMLEFQRRLIQRDKEVALLARQYRAQSPSGVVDDGFYEVLEQNFQAQDMFADQYDPAQLPRVTNPAELEQIKPGMWFVGPRGERRQRL